MSEINERCPFCGGEVDPLGWLSNNDERGPECETCGATAPSLDRWNTRVPSRKDKDYMRTILDDHIARTKELIKLREKLDRTSLSLHAEPKE